MNITVKEIASIVGGEIKGKKSRQNKIIKKITTDSRSDCSESLFFAIKGEKFDGHDYLSDAITASASAVCVSSKKYKKLDIPFSVPAVIVPNTLIAYQKLANYHRNKMGTYLIALTGSSGKTSTKEMLRTIFSQYYGDNNVIATEGNTNNHIGVPQNLFRLESHHKVAIIEMGTNHPGEIRTLSKIAEPDMAIIVSIGNAHIEFLGSIEGVAKEKSAIFAKMKKNGIAIFPADAHGLSIIKNACKKNKTYSFGTEESLDTDLKIKYLGSSFTGSSFEILFGENSTKETVRWELSGRHQALNAGAAALAAYLYGIRPSEIREAFEKGVKLPKMRMKICEIRGIMVVNDAYNANPDSMKSALDWLLECLEHRQMIEKTNVYIVLGDMLELGKDSEKFHKEILDYAVAKFADSKIAVVGQAMSNAAKKIKKNVFAYPDSSSVAKVLVGKLKRGDILFIKGSRGIGLEKIEMELANKADIRIKTCQG